MAWGVSLKCGGGQVMGKKGGYFSESVVIAKGFFSLRPAKPGEGRGSGSRKLMKPCGELNRSPSVAL
jgi:hypothetical protein